MLIHVVVVIHQIQLIYSASLCAFRRRHANNLIEAAQNDKEKSRRGSCGKECEAGKLEMQKKREMEESTMNENNLWYLHGRLAAILTFFCVFIKVAFSFNELSFTKSEHLFTNQWTSFWFCTCEQSRLSRTRKLNSRLQLCEAAKISLSSGMRKLSITCTRDECWAHRD